ncbi:MAG: hypothetical protein JO166_09215 [Deltaproteobacteria bacterium]|nr:hypothetical protein [Deltaproteobacteria bacterium]
MAAVHCLSVGPYPQIVMLMWKVARPQIAPLAPEQYGSSWEMMLRRWVSATSLRISACQGKARGENSMFDRVRSGRLDQWLKQGHKAERGDRRSAMYGQRFALAGAAILVVVGLFVIV